MRRFHVDHFCRTRPKCRVGCFWSMNYGEAGGEFLVSRRNQLFTKQIHGTGYNGAPPPVFNFWPECRLATEAKSRDRVVFDDYELDCRIGELRRNGNSVKLQPQPAKVLSILVSRAGE